MVLRILFYAFILLVPLNLIGNNIENSPWPLVPGNVWYLEDLDNWNAQSLICITDSIEIEGDWFYYSTLTSLFSMRPYTLFRTDSIGDVYTYGNDKVQLLLPFGAKDTNYHFVSCDSIDSCWVKLTFGDPDDSVDVFPGLKGNRVTAIFDHDTIGDDGETIVYFVTSVGPVGTHVNMGPGSYELKGCIINGKQYGTTKIILPDMQFINQHPIFLGNNRKFLTISKRITHPAGYTMFTLDGRRLPFGPVNAQGVFILHNRLK